jgi:hypothetical protein
MLPIKLARDLLLPVRIREVNDWNLGGTSFTEISCCSPQSLKANAAMLSELGLLYPFELIICHCTVRRSVNWDINGEVK